MRAVWIEVASVQVQTNLITQMAALRLRVLGQMVNITSFVGEV
jgi:hypothetical protein